MKNAIPPALLRQIRHFFKHSQTWLLLFAIALLAGLPKVSAQTGQRADLHSLTQPEQEELARLIRNWVNESSPNVAQFHEDCFSEGIHSTNNFLPWHRIHIQELEDYIRDSAGVNFPNFRLESFRLPRWRPEVADPDGGPKIPLAFQGTASGIPNDDMNFNIDTTGLSFELGEMAQFMTRLESCSNLPDAGFFSDFLEGKYHDHGHTVVGGVMNEDYAPDALIFWPWHGWIDDLWYIWERDCGALGEPYDFPFVNGDTVTEFSGTPPAWTDTMYIKGEIRIKNGTTLTIGPGAVIYFRESRYNAFPTRIVVEPGATLTVDGATLTGMDVFGDISIVGDDPGSKYYTAWEGIVAQGSPGNPGQVQLLNATIEHAIKGVRSENGGQIYASNTNFYNNRIDAEVGPYSGHQYASFFYCNFINDQPLRDIVWTGGTLDAVGTCPGGVPEHHVNHTQTHSTEAHIVLNGVRGAVSLFGCTIDNTFQDPHGNYMSRGVVANNSQYYVTSCNIKNQVIGISGRNTLPGPGNHVRVRYSTFDNNFEGISLFGVDNAVIDYTNTFKVPDVIPSGVAPDSLLSLPIHAAFGIYTEGASALTVADNGFSTVGGASANNYGAILSNTGGSGVITPAGNSAASVEKRNHFNGVGTASQTQESNGNLQIRCNDYKSFQLGIAVTSGTLQTQGLCVSPTSPAGNTWDNPGCANDDNQVYRDVNDSNPFTYWAHSDRRPTCYSAGVSVPPCPITFTPTSCDDPIIPCPRCEESRIATLETQKNALPPGDEKIQFIAHEQQSIYQQGVNERLENESEGLDVAITFTQNVEAITSLWPGNKAALLLLKSEQEGSIVSSTTAAIAAIAESDPTKKWFTLRYDLLTSGRDYSQLTATEKAMVQTEAQQQTKSGAHAKAILEMAYGIPARPNIEPIDGERNAFFPASHPKGKAMSIVPNPAQGHLVVSFIAPETAHQSSLEIADINGRVLRQFDLSNHFGDSQLPVVVDCFSPGIYLVRLRLNGVVVGIEKMAVIR